MMMAAEVDNPCHIKEVLELSFPVWCMDLIMRGLFSYFMINIFSAIRLSCIAWLNLQGIVYLLFLFYLTIFIGHEYNFTANNYQLSFSTEKCSAITDFVVGSEIELSFCSYFCINVNNYWILKMEGSTDYLVYLLPHKGNRKPVIYLGFQSQDCKACHPPDSYVFLWMSWFAFPSSVF